MENNILVSIDFIKNLKQQILSSRYIVAKIANAESLKLYFSIGKAIEHQFKIQSWGAKVLDTISLNLQQELPGLRGFSGQNLSKMRVFYNAWRKSDSIGLLSGSKSDNTSDTIYSLPTSKLPIEDLFKADSNSFISVSLDDLVKQTHENPSIGIILCKEKDDKKVEYSFRDFSKPMGVATYKTSETLPPELQKVLPDAETLKKLLN